MMPQETYASLMQTIKGRFDVIAQLKLLAADNFARAESAAFQGRKIMEGVAFACLVAIENGLSVIPKDAKGKWNAEDIFKSLRKKGLEVLPSPSAIRVASSEERRDYGVKIVIDGLPDRRLTHEELIEMYQMLHRWAHELNPYTHGRHDAFYEAHGLELWNALERLERFLERHFISIRGKAFYCTLWYETEGCTKVLPLEKVQLGAEHDAGENNASSCSGNGAG